MLDISGFFVSIGDWTVSAERLGIAFFIIFLSLLSRRVIKYFFSNALSHRVAQTTAKWDDDVVELLPAPLAAVVQIALWYAAALVLDLPTEPDVKTIVLQGLRIGIIFAITWVFYRGIDILALVGGRLTERTDSRLDDQLVPLLRTTLKVFLAMLVAVVIVQEFGYSAASIIASLGIGGVAVALAAKDTLANFFGSIVVFTDRPFHVGDWVEFAGVEGTVEEVGFRTTRIRQFDKALVTVPNQMFTTNPITNYSNRSIRRIKMTVGVTYETSSTQLRAFLDRVRQLLVEHPDLDQNFHFAHFVEFGASSLDVQLYCFTKTAVWTDWLAAREALMLQIMDVIEDLGLEIAYPTRTVYLRDEQWQQEVAARSTGAENTEAGEGV